MKTNYYEVLGLERTASEGEIRERFRALARTHHPDRFQGAEKAEAETKFQELTAALNILTNPAKRQQHDSELQSFSGKSATDPTQVAKVYAAHGVKAYKEGNFAAAAENFDMSVKHNPADAKMHHLLALASARVPSLMRQAVQAIEAAVQREPYNPVYLKDAGLLCRRVGLGAKAERYLEEALKWDAENIEVRNALAELRQGRETKEGGRGLLDLFKKG
jgi:curved DNA-binding protein CbpA